MIDLHDILLALHVAAGSLGLALGPVAMLAEREPSYSSRAGTAYQWSVLAVSVTAVGLVALDPSALWWLSLLAALAYSLALLGFLAARRRGPGVGARLCARTGGLLYRPRHGASRRVARGTSRPRGLGRPDSRRLTPDRVARRPHLGAGPACV